MSAWSWLRAELSGLLHHLLPPSCPLCGLRLAFAEGPLCAACLTGIRPVSSPCCPICALPYPAESGPDHLCEPCLRTPPPFVRVGALGIYEGDLRQAVHRFKFHGAVDLDRPLGRLLAEALAIETAACAPDLVVPVPLHVSRLKERTYNQSLLLARVLGRLWRIPVAPRLLVRIRPTPSQQGLTAEERRRNLRRAFVLRERIPGARVLLIDDVMTTGATARECALALRRGGAREVAVAVLARARRQQLSPEYPCPVSD